MKISQAQIDSFQKKILSFYRINGRHQLPWRQTTDRYKILVSEIMLQQTQVIRVKEKYSAWIKLFPTIQSLANAPLAKVLQAWSGLGFNSRAKRLQDTAKIITVNNKGKIPSKSEELQKLPGIGPYTARSILIFADNAPLATVDTNIRRILLHEFSLPKETSEKELFLLAEKVLPKNKSRLWHNALMDYGALYLTSKKSGIKPKTTQSTFKNSRRFYRGKIIKELVSKKSLTLKEIKTVCAKSPFDVQEILESLRREQLVKKSRKKREIIYSLGNTSQTDL